MNRRSAVAALTFAMAQSAISRLPFSPVEKKKIVGYCKNPDLEDILPTAIWPGTPLDQDGRFINHEFPMENSFYDVIRWKLGPQPWKEAKKRDSFRHDVDQSGAFLQDDRDCIVWLGHASFFIRLSGKHILIDPVIGAPPTLRRKSVFPVDPALLSNIDYILLSHDHRDHLDKPSILRLSKQNPQAIWLAGLGMKDLLKSWTNSNQIFTAGWFQRFPALHPSLQMAFVPSRHWAKRELHKTNYRLWGGFVLQNEKHTLYFGGDSGLGNHFQMTKEAFGSIDYFLVGIGAYEPKWFMAPNHMSPHDACEIIRQIQPRHTLAMHHSTFDLSDEPLGEPLRQFSTLISEQSLPTNWINQPMGSAVWL
jgi:L-ascorbate metabolism protein UlaG (beta-lactamase superfamily)